MLVKLKKKKTVGKKTLFHNYFLVHHGVQEMCCVVQCMKCLFYMLPLKYYSFFWQMFMSHMSHFFALSFFEKVLQVAVRHRLGNLGTDMPYQRKKTLNRMTPTVT